MTMSVPSPEALVITGPTGTGKSELAVAVAERVGGEIISADSRQIYRRMDIGTGKPGQDLRARVIHHGLDLVEPDGSYSAGRFAVDARRWIGVIRGRGRVPVIVGGTGFFIRALLDPLAGEPDVDDRRRDRLRRYLSGCSVRELKRWLTRLDPARAEQLSAEGGRQRLSRSLEVCVLSGRSHSWWIEAPPAAPAAPPLSALLFCLSLPLDQLYARLERRFGGMVDEGLLDEVRELARRFPEEAPGFKSLGYAQLMAHLRGEWTLDQALEEAKRHTRRFARRQLTWFRHQLPGDAVWLRADVPCGRLARVIAQRWVEATAGTTGSPPSAPVGSVG